MNRVLFLRAWLTPSLIAFYIVLGILSLVSVETVFLSDAFAQAIPSATTPPSGSPPPFLTVMGKMIPMFGIVFVVFWLLVLLPQKKEQEAQQALLTGLKKGDSVVTTGGIIGRVTAINDDSITVALEQNAAMKVERNHIAKKI
jgi:preprotein translocase subunit YajC